MLHSLSKITNTPRKPPKIPKMVPPNIPKMTKIFSKPPKW